MYEQAWDIGPSSQKICFTRGRKQGVARCAVILFVKKFQHNIFPLHWSFFSHAKTCMMPGQFLPTDGASLK